MKTSLFLSLFILSFGVQVGAQSNPEYEEIKGKAKRAYKEGRFEDAALLYKEAFEVEPRGSVLYNIGFCYEKAENFENAITFYQRFTDALPRSLKRPAVQRRIEELKGKLVDRYAEISVESQPSGAQVFVNDKSKGSMGATPVSFKLLDGSYTLILEKEGFESLRKVIRLKREPLKVAVRLLRSDLVGNIQLMISQRGAVVIVDEKRVGQSPLFKPLRLSQGNHKIQVLKPGFAPWERELMVKASDSKRISIDLSGESGGSGAESDAGGGTRIWPWITMGLGVASLGGATFYGLQANSLYGQLEEKRDNDQLIAPEDIDLGDSMVLNSNVLLGLGSAALIGGFTWWILGKPGERESSASLRLEGGSTMSLQGSF